MKKLLVFILLIILFCGINLNFTKELDLKSIFGDASAEVYLNDDVFISEYETIKNGSGKILRCGVEDVEAVLKCYNASGFTIKVKNIDLDNILKSCKLSHFKSGEYVYGYCDGLFAPLRINDEYVNFQCVQKGGDVLFGSPILLGSY